MTLSKITACVGAFKVLFFVGIIMVLGGWSVYQYHGSIGITCVYITSILVVLCTWKQEYDDLKDSYLIACTDCFGYCQDGLQLCVPSSVSEGDAKGMSENFSRGLNRYQFSQRLPRPAVAND